MGLAVTLLGAISVHAQSLQQQANFREELQLTSIHRLSSDQYVSSLAGFLLTARRCHDTGESQPQKVQLHWCQSPEAREVQGL